MMEGRPEPALSEVECVSSDYYHGRDSARPSSSEAECPAPEDFDGREGRGQRSARETVSASYGVSSASSLFFTLDVCTENASRRNTYGCASTDPYAPSSLSSQATRSTISSRS